jgi:hypothetical protein
MFYWEKVKFGLKPTLCIVQVLTMHGDKPDQPPYVIAEKQLYASRYFETALELTFLLMAATIASQSSFYLMKAIGCEQACLTGFKGSILRRIEVSRAVPDLEKSLASTKHVLEQDCAVRPKKPISDGGASLFFPSFSRRITMKKASLIVGLMMLGLGLISAAQPDRFRHLPDVFMS